MEFQLANPESRCGKSIEKRCPYLYFWIYGCTKALCCSQNH